MKTILVPMDSSAAAENALLFAILLAQKLPAKLVLVNAFQITVPVAEVPFEIIEEEIVRKKKEAEQMLHSRSLKIGHAGTVAFDYVALEGNADDTILGAAKSRQADYIIMGMKGEGHFAGGVMGRTASRVIERAGCPVIALPEGTTFSKPIHRITFATDFHQSDIAVIQKLVTLAAAWKAQVTVLHVGDDTITAQGETKLMSDFMARVNSEVDYNNMTYQMVYGNDVVKRLDEYIQDQNTDMLVMSTHPRRFFEKLFRTGITMNIVNNTTVPVIAFHYNPHSALQLI